MAIFDAFFDASGHPDDPLNRVLFVSGFVSTEDRWLAFEDEWLALLKAYSIAGVFHMKEFAVGAGQYAAWKDDLARRRAFSEGMVATIKRHTLKSFSAGAVLKDFAEARGYGLPEWATYPYPFCASMVISAVYGWLREQPEDGPLKFFFEDGEKHKGKFIDTWEAHTGWTPIFLKKEECVPFQPADFLAWEHRRMISDSLGGQPYRIRGSLAALDEEIPHDQSWRLFDKRALKAIARDERARGL